MKRRWGLVSAGVIGAVLNGAGLVSTSAPAATGALAQADPIPFWWFHGTVEVGGRFFLNNPSRNGHVYQNEQSLAKFYNYSSLKPGPFSNIAVSTGSKDGLYRIDLGGKNIGYSDQEYYFDLSKAGQHYLNFGWDQTPRIEGTGARTAYQGVGTDRLTLPTGAKSAFTSATISGIEPYLNETDVGFRRDKATVDYRWTPSDAWDIKADYSHLTRKGTIADGVVFGSVAQSGSTAAQVTKPVDDTTQNFGLNGEYAGISPWNQKFTFKLGYEGSQYSDTYSSYTADNPFTTGSALNRLSLWPSNKANGFNGTLAAELPQKSRLVSTVSYTMMRQDADFLPMTANPVPGNNPYGVSWGLTSALPATSLNGAINTFLSNNVLTTQIAPDLKSKLSYRIYQFKNNTPVISFPAWVSYDGTSGAGNYFTHSTRTLSLSYLKQDTGTQLNWRPSREWNLTADYGYQRYNYEDTPVDATNEHSGKLSADWKPTSWLTARSSVYYANRRYVNYDQASLTASQWPTVVINGVTYSAGNAWKIQPAYRQLMFDNRQRTKANFAVDIVVLRGVTITPNFKYQDDNYGLNTSGGSQTQFGLNDRRTLGAGVDVGWIASRDLSMTASYLFEHQDQSFYSAGATGPTDTTVQTNSNRTNMHTFVSMVNYAAIPNTLDLNLRYMLSRGTDSGTLTLPSGKPPTGGQYLADTTWLQRLEATATYKFDRAVVSQMGWEGNLKARLRYMWERNSVANWQNDSVAPYSNTGVPNQVFLGYDNPNYNVHLVAASLLYTW